MSEKFNFQDLFVYDLANNHQGSLSHGLKVIDSVSKVSNEEGIKGGFKFQFRQIDTFIHPDFKDRQDVPHIPRFMSTRLTVDDYVTMVKRVKEHGLYTICTPFDEDSVDIIEKLKIEIIKVASCSASDWPLLKRIAESDKPVILSTAGLNINQIDDVASFFEIEKVDFALMHCVALYPTPMDKLQLNQIEQFRRRYPHVTIGFSTHEDPDNYFSVRMAVAKGAKIFERHVGYATEEIKLNAYSSTPEQVRNWIHAYKEALDACGSEHRPPVGHKEEDSLNSLKRGVYLSKSIKKGEPLTKDSVFFAMPIQNGQLESGLWRPSLKADRSYKKNEPVVEMVAEVETTEEEIISRIVLQVKGMLNEARISLGKDFEIELSHHYGLHRFREFGAVIIDCINRDYCKKLILQLPRQKHPYHYHKRKEETFQVLFGDLEAEVEGNEKNLHVGDSLVVHKGEWHKFQTNKGVIFEEVSTTHYNNDSFYEDKHIAHLPREARKTKIENWVKIKV